MKVNRFLFIISVFSLLFFSCKTTNFVEVKSSEYSVEITDNFKLTVSEAFECVAMICHLAGFQEYQGNNEGGDITRYDEYFKPYLTQKSVAIAVNHFSLLRSKYGFAYDAPASIATYMTSDCHGWRTDLSTVKKHLDSRCVNPEQILKYVADFYDATNFNDFYENELDRHREIIETKMENIDFFVSWKNYLENYYKITVPTTTISFSFLNGRNNYGVSFVDKKNTYLEPKYWVNAMDSKDPYLFIHELSHPTSNPVAIKLYENNTIKKYIDGTMKGPKLQKMIQMTYGTGSTYLIELLNRANTILIMQEFSEENYIERCLEYEKQNGFDEIEELVNILKEYKVNNFSSFMDFEAVLEKRFIEEICK